jgi:serine O-acetyltransferase
VIHNLYPNFYKDVQFLKSQKLLTPGRLPWFFKALLDPSLYICINYRIAHALVKFKLLFLSKLFWFFNYIFFHVDVDPRCELAGGCMFVHPIGIVVGAHVKSKGYLKLYQGVTLGGSFDTVREIDGEQVMQPIIDEYVMVGPGAKILGPLKISSYSIVGANCVISKEPLSNGLILSDKCFENHEYLKEFKKWPQQ